MKNPLTECRFLEVHHMVLTLAQTKQDRDTTVVLVMYRWESYCMSCKAPGTDGSMSSDFKDLLFNPYTTYSMWTANIPPYSTQILPSLSISGQERKV
jgi:hypothetical protein